MGFSIPLKSKQGLVTQDCSLGADGPGISVYQHLVPEAAPENPVEGLPSFQLLTVTCEEVPLRQLKGLSSKSSK
jgi:hypothetical protein